MQTKEWNEHYSSQKFLQWWPNEAIIRTVSNQIFKNNSIKSLNILDFGCGNGRHMRYLLEENQRKNSEIFVSGIDISKEAIRLADMSLKKQFNSINFSVSSYDGEKIPFDDNSFDYVISIAVLDQLKLSDALKINKEIFRVLKDSGKFFLDVEYLPENKSQNDLKKNGSLVESNTIKISQGCEKNIFQHYFSNDDIQNLFKLWKSFFISERNSSLVFSKDKKLRRESNRCIIVSEK